MKQIILAKINDTPSLPIIKFKTPTSLRPYWHFRTADNMDFYATGNVILIISPAKEEHGDQTGNS